MTITTHTLLDIVVAFVTTVGIAVAISLALMAAGALYERAQVRRATPRRGGVGPAPHPTQTDTVRDLVLR